MKKIIVVTGASSGMGREFVLQILEKEPNIDEVWAIARRKDRLEELHKINNKIIPISLDLSDEKCLSEYKKILEKEEVNIKILVNCAGYGKFEHIENLDNEIQNNMIDLNCKAVVTMTNYSLPYMKRGSKIVNFASLASVTPIPYINIYAATKAFVRSYSFALFDELKYKGIHVLAVAPYWTKTEFFDVAETRKDPVVIKFDAMYDPVKLIKKVIKDLYNDKKRLSAFGFINNVERIALKLIPYSWFKSAWFSMQKYDGTPKIRKEK